jgi:hypothetical protein
MTNLLSEHDRFDAFKNVHLALSKNLLTNKKCDWKTFLTTQTQAMSKSVNYVASGQYMKSTCSLYRYPQLAHSYFSQVNIITC